MFLPKSEAPAEQSAIIIDSGANAHVCNDLSRLINYKPFLFPKVAMGMNGSTAEIYGIGDLPVKTLFRNGREGELIIRNVFYMPCSYNTLISTEQLRRFYGIFYSSETQVLYEKEDETGKIVVLAEIDSINCMPVLREASGTSGQLEKGIDGLPGQTWIGRIMQRLRGRGSGRARFSDERFQV